MTRPRVLFISGSLGLGHAARDLAIAQQLRQLCPQIEIDWLAAPPASDLLRHAGEVLVPEAGSWAAETAIAESTSSGYSSNIFSYVVKAYRGMDRNAEIFREVTDSHRFDVVVGDETYELWEPLVKNPRRLDCPFVMMYDFCGFDARGGGVMESLGSYYFNRMWVHADRRLFREGRHRALFVGEAEDIPVAGLGPLLPDRRAHATEHYRFVGYALTFELASLQDAGTIRRQLGYGDGPLVVASVGGTAIGKPLLDLCAQSLPYLRSRIPDLQVLIASGPRIPPDSLDLPADCTGLRVEGYVPDLFQHFAACDAAVVQAGGTTTIELTALGTPFLYFPLQDHFEQEIAVSGRLARHGAGTRMCFAEADPASLADAIVAQLERPRTTPTARFDGARTAAREILEAVGL